MKLVALLAVCIVLAGALPVSAAPVALGPTMHTVVTTVVAITPYTHGNGVQGCTIIVAKGMNGNTLTDYGALCSTKRAGSPITLNYIVNYVTRYNWLGRAYTATVYTFSNAY